MSEVHPRVRAALETQLDAWRQALQTGAARVGWKIGLDFPEVEAVIGDEPVLGHLTSATVLEDGGTFTQTEGAALRAETEVVVELGDDERIAALGVALEIVDVTRPPYDLEGIVAQNCYHRAVVLGRRRLAEPGEARAIVNGELRQARPTPEDLPARVRAAATHLAAVGEELVPGDVLLAGSSTHVPVERGDRVVAEIDGLGRVGATIG